MIAPEWAQQPCWRILDIGFEFQRFLKCWQIWRNDSQRPLLLHYVALTQQIPDLSGFSTEQLPLAQELASQCHSLETGFQRISLEQGRVLLTLCVGERRAMLREQQFSADSVFLDAAQTTRPWDRWDFKALARCCRRGTSIASISSTPALLQSLADSGFEMSDAHGQYAPRWDIKTTRETLRLQAAEPTSCAVIGAGLAGASVAAALARRGWQVQVLDAAPEPAEGASGLPAGLVVPHVSLDDSPRSRLSRSGVRLTLQQARELLQEGQDWQPSGVLEKGLGQKPDLWHAQAGWIKPAQLVRAWLAQPGIHFKGNSRVASLRKVNKDWELLDDLGHLLASARHVVLANALSVQELIEQLRRDNATLSESLNRLPVVHGMRGAVTWGLRRSVEDPAFPLFPVNGLGSLIPAVPTRDGLAWYAGATYESMEQPPAQDFVQHQANLEKLQELLPETTQSVRAAQTSGQLHLWSGTRCVSSDRMPLVGPLETGQSPSLWISSAMGSRGLSFAVLCAELLAARMGAEPWPVEASLARFLQATRRPA